MNPLPRGKPSGFSGGVGEFKLTAAADKYRISVSRYCHSVVAVQAIPLARRPDFPAVYRVPNAYRQFTNIDQSKGAVEGSKVYMVLVRRRQANRRCLRLSSIFSSWVENVQDHISACNQCRGFTVKSTGVAISPILTAQSVQQLQQEISISA